MTTKKAKLPKVVVLMNGTAAGGFPASEGKKGILFFASVKEAKRYQRRVPTAKKHRPKVVSMQELFRLKNASGVDYFARTNCEGDYWFTPGVIVRHESGTQTMLLDGGKTVTLTDDTAQLLVPGKAVR